MLEIERQFLVRSVADSTLASADRVHRIRQGYLTVSGPAIRVREIDGTTVMTVKSGGGLIRREIEFEIAPDVAEGLFEIAGDRLIEKTRYVVGGWEIDVFEGRHAGLLVAEVELDHAEQPTPPIPLGLELWREVTEAVGFTNQFLSSLDGDEVSMLLEQLAKDVSGALAWAERRAGGAAPTDSTPDQGPARD